METAKKFINRLKRRSKKEKSNKWIKTSFKIDDLLYKSVLEYSMEKNFENGNYNIFL